MKRGSVNEQKFILYWRGLDGPDLFIEHQFHSSRKWRFDFAHPQTKVAIEVEGGVHTGGRHTRSAGFENDCEKYLEGALQGWVIFRLTPQMINVPNIERIKRFINLKMQPPS